MITNRLGTDAGGGIQWRRKHMRRSEAHPRPLRFRNALHVKMAENWLALGQVEDALRELNLIPLYARKHPAVQRVRDRLAALPTPLVDLWLSRAPAKFKKGRPRIKTPRLFPRR